HGDPADLLLVVLLDRGDAGELGDLGLALGLAGLEQLDHPRQAVRDVLAGDAAGVERPHGELRARLADRLGRDDAHGLADVDESARCETASVARAAHAVHRVARQYGAHVDGPGARFDELRHQLVADLLALRSDLLAVDL